MIYYSLKDTPDGCKAGTAYLKERNGKYTPMDIIIPRGIVELEPRLVENNPDWFKMKEQLKVKDFCYVDGPEIPENLRGFHFKTSGRAISPSEYKGLIQQIESYFNFSY